MPAPRAGFAAALQAALQRRDLDDVERVLQLYAGAKVYLPRSLTRQRDAGAAVALAHRLLAMGIRRDVVARLVAQRRQISPRHARRAVARALADTLGQAVAAR